MKRNTINVLVGAFLILSFLKSPAQGIGIGEWRDHLPYDYATNVEEFKNLVFASTPYSLFYYDRDYSSVHRLSKVNGLSDLGVSDISNNPERKILVVAYTNCNVDLIQEDMTIINIPDIKRKEILGNKTINSIMNFGKYAYLSCGFGIVVVNLERNEIKDTYYIGPEGSYINVLAMAHNDTAFYAATEKGIYYADIDDPNLAYFGNWHKMTGIPYPNGMYSLVYVFNEYLMINHHDPDDPEDDLYVLRNGEWSDLEIAPAEITNSIRHTGNNLVISYKGFVKNYDENLVESLKIYTYGSSNVAALDALLGGDGNYWLADNTKGMARVWGGGYENEFIKPSGAPTAEIFDMDIRGGDLWLVPGGIDGTWNNTWRTARIFSFIDESWNTLDPWNTPALDSLRDMVSITVDPQNPGRVYAGSWWKGLVELTDGAFTAIYGTSDGALEPHLAAGAPVVKVGKTAFDSEHNLWVVNSGAEDILAVNRNTGGTGGEWQSYNLGSSSQGNDVMRMIVDSYDQKWLVPRTTQSNPNYIYVFDEKSTSGKTVRALRSGVGFGNLPGTAVFSLAEDLEGEVWVGTDEGIAVFYNPGAVISENADAERILVDIDGYVQYLLETETVKALAVDGANRKWIGTERAGVFLLSPDGQEQIYHFTEDNSPLLSNSITCIVISDTNGEVFFGTSKGLISYRSTATPGGPTNNDVYAFPNPVKSGYTGPIAIKGLVANASVKITDVNGMVVYETRAEGGQAIWYGMNFDGRKANSGVYLVFITDSDGSDKMVTKILFLN
jgi:hypothetical protein